MRWICKITVYGSQNRITLPKGFCKAHNISGVDHVVIDDRDPENITIRRLVTYGNQKRNGKINRPGKTR